MLYKKGLLKDLIISVLIMFVTFVISIVLKDVLLIEAEIDTVFVFAVFLISVLTDGYVYGIVSALVGVIAVNFVFTFPYFAFSISLREDLLSALLNLIITLMTSTLVTRMKRGDAIKAESEREKMRANLLRGVSHDLRTPLTAIYGSSSLLLDNYDTVTDEQKRKLISGVKEDSEWLIRIFENLLSVTKLSDGAIKLIKAPTVIDEVVDSVLMKFKKRYPEQSVKLIMPESVLIVPMDAILIEQVLVNILENAVQHANRMTELSLEIGEVSGRALFIVRDNGEGIDKKRIANLFTGCVSAEAGNSDSHKRNAGIGLSVCATIIKAHGGEIWAKNREGGGAEVGFALDAPENYDEQQ